MMIVVVVPFLNEERFLPTFLRSIAGQTRPPDRLLLVDDGSRDGSGSLAVEFARNHGYAVALRRPPRPPERDRLASAAELRAFQWAVEQLDGPWDVVAKVDADLQLTPNLLAEIEDRFCADPNLGMAGSYLSYVARDGSVTRQRCPVEHVEGPTKFYRRQCYDDIAPLPAILGWDTCDEIRARMRGWATSSFAMPGGDPVHLRPIGSHDGALRAYRRWGRCAYGYGESALFAALTAVQRLPDPPPVLGGGNYLFGWALAAMDRAPRADPEVRAYVHHEQRKKIRRRLFGPQATTKAALR
jgi:glycosyltransferase involved in cell wall biosynthesis